MPRFDKSSRLALGMLLLCAALGNAQTAVQAFGGRVMFVNDEWERYTRILQLTGEVAAHPWSVRAFGPREHVLLTPLSETHPWRGAGQPSRWRRGAFAVEAIPVQAQMIVNSTFPFGYNDGPIWAGRGITTAASGGVIASAGPVTITLAPLLFTAQNAAFPLRPNGYTGAYAYGDAFSPGVIDHPQRFGDGQYYRVDPGNSEFRVDVGPAAAGFSTASQHWGPARDHPLVLGNNAPGFAHVFVGTSKPANLWIARANARLFWGRLYQSPYSDMHDEQPHRFATGLSAVLTPRGMPHLEIGGARFFHILWSDAVINHANLTRTITGLLKISRIKASGNPEGTEPDNQLASLFARWVFPRSGLELYGEFAREDHNLNLRDLQSEPDHNSGYLLGFQRAWRRGTETRRVFRVELANTRVSSIHLIRGQAAFYVHQPVRQGHTNYGQVLGSFAALGGGATVVGLDVYTLRGRRTISWSRLMRAENRLTATGVPDPPEADVFHALTFDGLLLRGRTAITYEVTGVYELNRNFTKDAFNLRLATGIQHAW